MIEFGGYITVEDAERIRKMELIADMWLEMEDNAPPDYWKGYENSRESHPTFTVKDQSSWEENFDPNGNVVEASWEEPDSTESKKGSRRKSKSGGKKTNQKSSPSIDEDDDIFKESTDMKAIVKIFYEKTAQATVPYYVYDGRIKARKRKAFDEYLLVAIEPEDFME